MKVPWSWLLEYCDPGLGPEEVAGLLSMRAVEVERVSRIGVASTDGFEVGRVISAEQHPNADRLRVCEVETSEGVRTIVCGAPNVVAGLTVAVALPGARMPGGQKLKRAKLRGVESNGMILSERELGLGDDHSQIMELLPAASSAPRPGAAGAAGGLAPGTPLVDVLQISEAVLELDLNPNRVDCMGVYGVAREVHAITGAPLAEAPWERDADPTGASVTELTSVSVEVPELCPRFTARAFTEIELGPSPAWLRARLIAAGMRPISNAVDITNYVMLATAQPLHAFDLDRVPGGELVIRTAADGERMTTLDGVERALGPETVLVCDRERPTGIAGIMGGQVSEVSETTASVLLEVATWNGPNVMRTSARLGLRSDASARNEKGLHPELALRAQRMASRLYAELCGATVAEGTIDVAAEIPPAHVVSLHGTRLDSLLGVHIPEQEAIEHLERLDFQITPESQPSAEPRVPSAEPWTLTATVPFSRHFDVGREVDLIEEVGRLHGFDRVPRRLPAAAEQVGSLTRDQLLQRRAEDLLRDLGFDQISAMSLAEPDDGERLRLAADDPGRRMVRVLNPISTEHAALRTVLLGGLLDAARHNLARGAGSVALFETGRVYVPEPVPSEAGPVAGGFIGRIPPPAREPLRLGALVVGELAPGGWRAREPDEPHVFYVLKGVVELLAEALASPLEVVRGGQPFLHPGRTVTLLSGGAELGWLGELHPLVAREHDLPGGAAFELDLAPMLAGSGAGSESYADLTTFPAVHQDIAVTVAEETAADVVVAAVREGGGQLLARAEVFDVYSGDQVGAGRRGLALRLEFRAADRTLTDAEVAQLRTRIEAKLDSIGATLRG